jgi:hypothetical protein
MKGAAYRLGISLPSQRDRCARARVRLGALTTVQAVYVLAASGELRAEVLVREAPARLPRGPDHGPRCRTRPVAPPGRPTRLPFGHELAAHSVDPGDRRDCGGGRGVRRLANEAAPTRRLMSDDARERAWAAVHDAIARLPGRAVGPCVYHGDGELWHVAAIDLRPRGRQAKREAIAATGATEIAALVALLRARAE